MNQDKTILTVALGGNSFDVKTKAVYQYDHGLKLKLSGYDGSSALQLHFSNEDLAEAINMMVVQENGEYVSNIPDDLLLFDKDITAYVYEEDGESGVVIKKITIPVTPRIRPNTLTFDAPEQGPVNQMATELNRLTDEVNSTIDRTENLKHMDFDVEVAEGDEPTVRETDNGDGTLTLTFGLVQGIQGVQGEPGVSATHEWDGTRLIMTSASGTTTTDLKGEKGDPGISGETGGVGPQGEPGVSVTHEWNGTTLSVTSASGTSSADLKGEPGERGEIGPAGEAGKDGVSITHSWDGTKLTITSASGTDTVDLQGPAGENGVAESMEWGNIDNKPETFPPEEHIHEQYENTIYSITASEFEALTAEERAALYAQGVRVFAVDDEVDQDELTDLQRFANHVYPIGIIVELTVETNPATLFGVGTWESYLPGRVLIGSGTANSGTVYSYGQLGGEETHTLTESEIPAHYHTSHSAGLASHSTSSSAYEVMRSVKYSNLYGTTAQTNTTGGGGSHNNMPPYGVVYRWRRTA